MDTKKLDLQTTERYLFEAASECNDHCVKSFDSKDLLLSEKNCIQACFSKQMIVLNSLSANLSSKRR